MSISENTTWGIRKRFGYKPIARILMNKGIKSPGGCDIWRDNTVKSILTNERYIGDALLQKNFTVDFLNKKMKKNEGEVPQYYIEKEDIKALFIKAFLLYHLCSCFVKLKKMY